MLPTLFRRTRPRRSLTRSASDSAEVLLRLGAGGARPWLILAVAQDRGQQLRSLEREEVASSGAVDSAGAREQTLVRVAVGGAGPVEFAVDEGDRHRHVGIAGAGGDETVQVAVDCSRHRRIVRTAARSEE